MSKAPTKILTESKVVGTSLAVSISDVALNLIVSIITGSTAVLAQSLQGLSDVTTAGVLMLGLKRAKRLPDEKHPLGYGREVFFWALMSAIIMFLGTGALALYFGFRQFTDPGQITSLGLAIAMLIFGLFTNGFAFSRSYKLLKGRHTDWSWWRQIRHSAMVDIKITFLVDLLGTVAAVLGLTSLLLLAVTGNDQFDGLGAMGIGLATMAAAILVISDIHGLIIGRAASMDDKQKIIDAAMGVAGVERVVDAYVFYIGTDRLFAVLELHLADNFTTNEIEKLSDTVKERVHEAIPNIHRVQIEVETPDEELGFIS